MVDHLSDCTRESHEETCAHLNVRGVVVGKIQDFRPFLTAEGAIGLIRPRIWIFMHKTCRKRARHGFA
jgi:hypothetical protein